MRRELGPEEADRCIEFLHCLGVREADHRLLSDRGYFGIFLCGLSPEELPEDGDYHPSMVEFRETIRLLATAGIEQLRELVQQRDGARPGSSSSGTVKLPSGGGDYPGKPAANFRKDIKAVRPSTEQIQRLEQIPHAGSVEEAITLANQFAEVGRYHDAYHVISDFLHTHPIDGEMVEAAISIIRLASRFDRDRSMPPFNMLYECEELAAILARRIPEMFHVNGPTDGQTRVLYRCARVIYHGWIDHICALLEYKYRMTNKEWLRRNWLDPRDFGCVLDVMRLGVRSRLTLDLLRFVYTELKRAVHIGTEVIAHDDKKAKFEGDLLRIIASPTKDLVPDLTFEIYKDITLAYMREGDTQGALMFCKQALLMKNSDSEMLKLKAELSDMGAARARKLY